jgi:hypothetical protein
LQKEALWGIVPCVLYGHILEMDAGPGHLTKNANGTKTGKAQCCAMKAMLFG